MATHSSILAWKIFMDGETGGLQSWGHKESETTERLSIAPKTSVCYRLRLAPQVALVVKNKPASAGDVRNVGSIPGQKNPQEKGMETHSSLAWRIPMGIGAWWFMAHRVTKSWA